MENKEVKEEKIKYDKLHCNELDKCFAKLRIPGTDEYRCVALTETYPPGKCPFKKERSDVTRGVRYPYDPYYGQENNKTAKDIA